MASERGIVVRTGAGTAWVRTQKSSACEGCSAQGSCTAVGDDMEVEALNSAGARVGDRIVVTFATSPLLKATFLIYVMPIICLLVGAAAGLRLAPVLGVGPSAASAATGFLFFFAAAFVVKAQANRLARRDDYRPRITRVLRGS